jgi:hypothetical protein
MSGAAERSEKGRKRGMEEMRAAEEARSTQTAFPPLDTQSTLGRYAVYIILVYLALGCTFFSWAEEWPWTDALYFCVVTMTTVGYGDFVPSTDTSKLGCVLFILLGLSIGATCLGMVVGHLQGVVQANTSKISRGQRRIREVHVAHILPRPRDLCARHATTDSAPQSSS